MTIDLVVVDDGQAQKWWWLVYDLLAVQKNNFY